MLSRPTGIDAALEALVQGRIVVVSDDPARENEGNLVLAAQFATPEAINFMARRAGGWISLALSPERCDELGLVVMADRRRGSEQAPFTQTIEARDGVTTGISASDQAHSILVAIDSSTGPDDIASPGHVQPLRARPGGVLERAGHTEAAVDLTRFAGLNPAGVVCEVQNDDGSMAGPEDLVRFCDEHALPLLTIEDLIAYRLRSEQLVERVVAVDLPTAFGEFTAVGYSSSDDDGAHLALVKGDLDGTCAPLVHVHSRCIAGDALHSLRCDCGHLLDAAMAMIERNGCGALIYLTKPGQGVGLIPQAQRSERARESSRGRPASQAVGITAQILVDLGLESLRLVTTEPERGAELERYGMRITDTIEPLPPRS